MDIAKITCSQHGHILGLFSLYTVAVTILLKVISVLPAETTTTNQGEREVENKHSPKLRGQVTSGICIAPTTS